MLTRTMRTFIWLPALVGFAATSAWSGAQAPTVGAQPDPFSNDPQALGRSETHGVITVDAGSFVIAFRKDSNVFLGYSAEDGSWDRHEFPEKVVAVPVVTSQGGFGMEGRSAAGAFKLSGDEIEELVAVDGHGKFHATKLTKPTSGTLTPLIFESMILHVVDDTVYAFSGKTGTWGALTVPEEAGVEILRTEGSISLRGVIFDGGKATYRAKNALSIFSVDSGKWSTAEFEAVVP